MRPKFGRDCCGAARCLSATGAAAVAVSSSNNSADTVEAADTMAGRLAVGRLFAAAAIMVEVCCSLWWLVADSWRWRSCRNRQ